MSEVAESAMKSQYVMLLFPIRTTFPLSTKESQQMVNRGMLLTAVVLAYWILICRIRTPAKIVTRSVCYRRRKVTYGIFSTHVTIHTT